MVGIQEKQKNKNRRSMKGQITVFLALVFFVLFTLFGMTISMGMFIHDKINLQNATDLASYYVASKQAEMLTAIAHSNYQIRQSWKLATFRYRVIGNGARTVGASSIHPALDDSLIQSSKNNHTAYPPAKEFPNPSGGPATPPRVCIGATHMFKEIGGDNTCKVIDFSVSYVPKVASFIPLGIVGVTNSTITQTNTDIVDSCAGTAYANWWFANTIVGSHKLEQRDRRAVIEALAQNLAQPITPGGMKDLDGRDVFEGAQKTFQFNLSESNRENASAVINFENPLQGLSPSDWLKPILVNTVLPYSHFETRGSSCREELFTHVNPEKLRLALAASARATDTKNKLDPDDVVEFFGSLGSNDDKLLNLSVGVEKNPWIMVYNRARGRAVSKPLFLSAIFGSGVRMVASAYAKPFGGRIGPWYREQWQPDSPESDGGDKIDALLPPRVQEDELGTPADLLDPTLRPNYARFPGDKDGLVTRAAMVAAGKIVGDWGFTNPVAANVETSLFHYHRAVYSYTNESYNDPLAQNISPGGEPWEAFNRRMEIAAIAPDMFDMTYYTIVPGFFDYFVKGKLDQWLDGVLPDRVKVKGDIGAYSNEAPQEVQTFDIINQMQITNESELKDRVARPREAPWLFNPESGAFLSSWIPGASVMDYGAADQAGIRERFAKCSVPLPVGRVKIPSECLSGGRSGYSVKMISKKYLESEHPIGGAGISGRIKNIL